MDFFDQLPEYETALYVHKKMKTTEEIALDSLKACLPVLETLPVWEETAIHDSMMALVEEKGIKNGQMLWPLRTALSGKPTSPGGAIELADILGREESIRRINKGIELLEKC
ncbi:Glutamate--tRNA ligase [bioreactor metagenome]|uniref:Glutamate--tRNA ligase n=1 Tax=bioreactor metagenome TaxID=1076179 RepID=A0A645J1N6_9ZZZZ